MELELHQRPQVHRRQRDAGVAARELALQRRDLLRQLFFLLLRRRRRAAVAALAVAAAAVAAAAVLLLLLVAAAHELGGLLLGVEQAHKGEAVQHVVRRRQAFLFVVLFCFVLFCFVCVCVLVCFDLEAR